ncbi:MAG TPA: hypothetical protein VJN18_05305 [Polyangiaceae bacterium]|nr:hypothetical protein [Polyangiaceae bacterium]
MSSAFAQQQEDDTPQVRYRKAHQAIARKQWGEARDILRPLWAESKTYDVASSLAQVEYQLKNYAAGANYMAFALEHVAPMEKPEAIEKMRRGMTELRSKVGALKISVNQPDAEIMVNGQPIGRSPLEDEVFVEPGKLIVEARSPDAAPAVQSLEAVAGEAYTVELQLPEAKPADSAPRLVANAPTTTAVPTSDSSSRSADRPSTKPAWPLYVSGGVALVGVGMAIGFHLAANSAESDLNALKAKGGASGCADGSATASDCAARSDAIDRHNSGRTWFTVGIGVGITGAAATLGYLLLWPNRKRSIGQLEPVLLADGTTTGLRLTGTF